MRERVLRNLRLPPELQRTIVEQLTLNVIENGCIVPDAVIAYVNGIVHPQFLSQSNVQFLESYIADTHLSKSIFS